MNLDVTLAGRQFVIELDAADESAYRTPSDESDVPAILTKFQDHLSSSEQPGLFLDLLAGAPTSAAVWRSVLAAAGQNPMLARELGPLDELVRTLDVDPLVPELASVVRAEFPGTDESSRSRIEAHILESLPESEPLDAETYRRRQSRHRLLDSLDRTIVGHETGAKMDTARTELAASREGWGGPVDFDRWGDAEIEDRDRRAAELVETIESFVDAHINDVPSAPELGEPIGDIDELEALLEACPSGPLAGRASDLLVRVAVIWAKCTSDVAGPLHGRARERLLKATAAIRPEAATEPDDEPATDFIVVQTGPRTDAARGLLALACNADRDDAELATAIETLSQDPVRSVRHEVVSRAAALSRAAPELAWRILHERAANEPSQAVLRQVARQAWTLHSDISPALDVLEVVAGRPTDARGRYGALGTSAEALALIWVRLGNERAHSILEAFLHLDALNADAIGSVLHNLRKGGCFTDEDPQVRTRTLWLCTDLARQAVERVNQTQTDPPPTDEEAASIRDAAMLLDTVATQLYFAAGVHDARQAGGRPPTASEIRLVEEAQPLIETLATAPIGRVAHHLVEIDAFTLDNRPTEAIRSIAVVVAGGTRGTGYALESEAVKVLVQVVSTLLADHRSIFDDETNLTALRTVLEVFIEEGTPDAHQLIYGIGQIFR